MVAIVNPLKIKKNRKARVTGLRTVFFNLHSKYNIYYGSFQVMVVVKFYYILANYC